jgi:hypothetical protein
MRNWLPTFLILLPVIVAGCDNPIITIEVKGQPAIPAQPAPPRYQLVVTNPDRPYLFTYLLDTQTGALWLQKEITDLEGRPTLWVQEKFKDPVAPSSAQNPMSNEILQILHPPKTKEEENK